MTDNFYINLLYKFLLKQFIIHNNFLFFSAVNFNSQLKTNLNLPLRKTNLECKLWRNSHVITLRPIFNNTRTLFTIFITKLPAVKGETNLKGTKKYLHRNHHLKFSRFIDIPYKSNWD